LVVTLRVLINRSEEGTKAIADTRIKQLETSHVERAGNDEDEDE
jgi:hypothetical protein